MGGYRSIEAGSKRSLSGLSNSDFAPINENLGTTCAMMLGAQINGSANVALTNETMAKTNKRRDYSCARSGSPPACRQRIF